MSDPRNEQVGLIWSSKPGCFERQLQRQYRNALFPKELQAVTQAEVDAAKRRDSEEAEGFQMDLTAFAQSVATTKKEPAVSVPSLFHLLRQADHLHIKAIQLGGDLGREELDLFDLRDSIEGEILRIAPGQRVRLFEIRRLHELRQETRSHFAAQVTRPDSPITADRLIPALLTEDVGTIRAFAGAMEEVYDLLLPPSLRGDERFATPALVHGGRCKMAMAGIRRAALDLVLRLVTREEDAPGIADKLIALGVGQKR